MFEQFMDQPVLPTVWFCVVGFFWIGYVILDGFDLGVGMLMGRIFSRDEKERRLLLNTIGPVWDGNEVWLVTAGAATFAAFPMWYAALFSALYLPLTLLLLALILRAVSIEYRGKGSGQRWSSRWNALMVGSSTAIAFLIGAALALTTTGLPLNANGDRVGGPFAWVTWPAVLGGVAMVGFCLVHSLAFVALKTDGQVRHRARRMLVRLLPVALLPAAAWVLILQFRGGTPLSWIFTALAVLGGVLAWAAAFSGREGRAFAGLAVFIGAGMLAIFLALYPAVLPSTLAGGVDLEIATASSSAYTLRVMTVVGAIGVPVLLIYQSWTYWVFRKRLSTAHIPEAHSVTELATRPSAR
jgi:cytochrome d ubiquinol oxidase subunit II